MKSGIGIAAGMIFFGLIGVQSAKASGASDPYFEISQVQIEEVGFDVEEFVAPAFPELFQFNTVAPTVSVNEIINIAKMLWKVIEDNRPVANVKFDNANALPGGTKQWTELSSWQMPLSKTFRVTYQNGLGSDVVDFTFKVLYTYGGRFNGRGQYLTNVSIVPAQLSVAWGFEFNAQAQISAVTNAGTLKNPLAAMQLDLHWSVDSPVKHMEQTENFYVRGDGLFQQL